MSRVFFLFLFLLLSGEASQGRVCYQRGLTSLVFAPIHLAGLADLTNTACRASLRINREGPVVWQRQQPGGTFTKPPLLQESRLTGGGSPNLVVLVEWKVPVERFMGAANSAHGFHP